MTSFSNIATSIINNVYDLVSFQPPAPPVYIKDKNKFLTSTKAVSKAEYNLRQGARLEHVVYAPHMLDDAEAEAEKRLKQITIRSENQACVDFNACVHSRITTRGLTPKISSEKDAEMWIYHAFLRPALETLFAFISDLKQTGDLFSNHAFWKYLWISSSTGDGNVTPDFVMMHDSSGNITIDNLNKDDDEDDEDGEDDEHDEHDEDDEDDSDDRNDGDDGDGDDSDDGDEDEDDSNNVIVTIEIKASRVIKQMNGPDRHSIFSCLQSPHDPNPAEHGTAKAMQFIWPIKGDESPDKLTCVLVQVIRYLRIDIDALCRVRLLTILFRCGRK